VPDDSPRYLLLIGAILKPRIARTARRFFNSG
jgi:hypothetical protein